MLRMCAVSPDALHHAGSQVCVRRCDPKCHPRDRAAPGGQGMWCQCQVPGGLHFNNASCPALAGAPLWCVPETSVAWVFNHLRCTYPLPISPSPLLHNPHPPFFNSAHKLMRSFLSFCLSFLRQRSCANVFMCIFTCADTQSHQSCKIQSEG